MPAERLLTEEMGLAYAVSQWLRPYVEVAAETYVAGLVSLYDTFSQTFAEAERRAANSSIAVRIWIDVADRDLGLEIDRRMAHANRAAESIRRSVAPLFDDRAHTSIIEEAAKRENALGALSGAQVEKILATELSWWRRRVRRRVRR